MFSYDTPYYFRYNPVTIGTIHIYDQYPLVIFLQIGGNVSVGCNIHWIPGILQLKFINFIIELRKKSINPNMFKLYYNMIKYNPALQFALPSIRKYYNRNATNIRKINTIEMMSNNMGVLYKPRYLKRSNVTPTRHIVMKSKYHQEISRRR